MPANKKLPEVSCDDCYFMRKGLCALELGEPCTTFRPAEANLKPPAQLRLLFYAPGQVEPIWGFPTAAERAALHEAEKQARAAAQERVGKAGGRRRRARSFGGPTLPLEGLPQGV